VGQLVSIYAMGSLLAAIPLTRLTAGWPRRPLLLTAIAGFAIVSTITAVSTGYAVTLAARLFAGVFAGLLWTLLAAYATRMVAEEHEGRALAVAMAGVPIALCLGIPAGAWLGALVDSRPCSSRP
jgi:predicted MFS family arabinose efflux permease